MIQKGLRNLLVSNGAIAEIVRGGDGKNRVYPVRIPQSADQPALQECIVYARSSTDYTDGLDDDGDTAESRGPDTGRFRLECWGPTYDRATALAGLVETLFRTHKGRMGEGSGQTCLYCRVEDLRDEEVLVEDDGEKDVFLTVVDIAIYYDPAEVA